MLAMTSRPARRRLSHLMCVWVLALLVVLFLSGCRAGNPGTLSGQEGLIGDITPVPAPVATDTVDDFPEEAVIPVAASPQLAFAGDYLNLAEHTAGHYELQRSGEMVMASITTTRSPVQYWAREVTVPLFIVPPAFRPPFPVIRTVKGQPVHADGTPDLEATAPHHFLLQINPDGAVHYVDEAQLDGVGYLAYALHTVWGTTPPAHDRAILTILDEMWFEGRKLSAFLAQPEEAPLDAQGQIDLDWERLTQYDDQSSLYFNEAGRVTVLRLPRLALAGAIPPEVGQLTALEYLDLSKNDFTFLPPTIGQLVRLRYLNL